MSARLTALHEHYRKKRYNHRVVFGEPIRRVRRGWHSQYAVFATGQVFGYERWFADKYGTQDWTFHIGRAATAGRFVRVPGIKPGADIWLSVKGKTQITRLFEAIDAMKKAGFKPEEICEHRWRDIGIMLGPNGDPTAVIRSWTC